MTIATGSRLGPYEIVAPLGAGGMGEVYRARDTRLGRDVAIKVLRAEVAGDPERVKRFEKEARTVASLSHPNILALFDVGTHEGQPYLVTELLEGQTLAERIRSGDLTVAKAVELATQIAHGLAAAHEHGIVHRDLKPGNVFVTKGGVVKILDFGLARLTHVETGEWDPTTASTETGLTGHGAILGTVGYMSPEQIRLQTVDHRADIFSFGCVLYEMLGGKRPFQGQTPADTMSAILSKDPEPLPGTIEQSPATLDRIVRRCLEKHPEDRFQSARDLAFDLALISQVSAISVPKAAPELEWRRPRRWATIALATVASAALLAVGAFLVGKHLSEPQVPRFQRLTFQRGTVTAARFAPDGRTVVYSAEWDGAPSELFSVRLESPESRPLGYPGAELVAVAPSSELALIRNRPISGSAHVGTLARAPFSGGTPRDVDERISFADVSPDGREMAVVRLTDQGYQLEYPVGTVLAATSGDISHPRISRDGELVAFLERPASGIRAGSVAVVDRTGRKTTLATGLTETGGLAWSPRGDEIWFSASRVLGRQEMRAVRLDGSERPLYSQTAMMFLEDVAADGMTLVTEWDWRARIFFRGESDATERELSWLDWSLIGDLSPDGKWIAFWEAGEGAGRDPTSYVRETSGALPIKLGAGRRPRISADGRSVIVLRGGPPEPDEPFALALCPVGPGKETIIPITGMVDVDRGGVLPNNRTIWFVASEEAGRERLWLTDVAGAKPQPKTPTGVLPVRPWITPDGTHAVGGSGDAISLYPLAGGEPRWLKGVQRGEAIAGLGADGLSAFVYRPTEMPVKVWRVDLRTGQRELVREIMPSDRAGLGGLNFIPIRVLMTPDGKSYAYNTFQLPSRLFLIEGLK